MKQLAAELKMELSLDPYSNWSLQAGQVKVWQLDLGFDESDPGEAETCLSRDELERAGSFRFARDRRRYIRARCGLREILAGILGEDPTDLRFSYSAHGKPSLYGQVGQGRNLCFNVSHSGDLALICAAWNLELGIDLEQKCQDLSVIKSVQWLFHERERHWLDSQAPELRLDAFYKLWTLKEAVGKATGLGLGSTSGAAWIQPQAGDSASIVTSDGGQGLPWRVKSFIPRAGVQAAIAFTHENAGSFQLDCGPSPL